MCQEALESVYRAIDETNQLLPDGQRLAKSPGTVLFGGDTGLDSVGLLGLIAALARTVEEDHGIALSLLDEEVLSYGEGSSLTAGQLAAYITSKRASDAQEHGEGHPD